MKKTLALIMSLVMMLSCIIGASISSSATELEWVEETYTYRDALDAVGSHADALELDDDTGAYNSEEGFFFCDGLWTYEYWDPETETFKPMTAYFKDKQEGWVHGSWSNIYTSFAESAWSKTGYSYCSIMSNGKTMHPGDTAGCVVTFIVPVSGTISYDASIYAYGEGNTSDKENGGDYVTLWVNDQQVFPATTDDPESSRIYYDTTSTSEPFKVSYPSFKVNEGDKIRLCVTAAAGTNGGKGTTLVDMPTITYHEAAIPVGNPNGIAPANIITERVDDNTVTDVTVTWDPAKNAVGYNIYLKASEEEGDAVKVNSEPITDTKYVLTGLASATMYEVTVSSVMASGSESETSEPQTFRTRKVDTASAPATDTSGADASALATTDTASAVTNSNNDGGFPVWIIIVAAVAVVAIVVVLVIVLGKKKKPAEAAPATEEAAPAEEKKDEE